MNGGHLYVAYDSPKRVVGGERERKFEKKNGMGNFR